MKPLEGRESVQQKKDKIGQGEGWRLNGNLCKISHYKIRFENVNRPVSKPLTSQWVEE